MMTDDALGDKVPASSWTDIIPRTDHNAIFLDADYAATSLGPLQDWDSSLRLYASLVFSDSRPACVYWGPKRVAFYNEGFGVCCGGVQLMARGFQEAFPTLWEQMGPVFEQVAATAKTVDVDNILLFPERHGYLEETYFVGQFIPLRAEGSAVEGFYNTVYETTPRVLHERRRKVVDLIAAIPVLSVDETLSSIVDALKANAHDITMAILYSFDTAVDECANLHLRGSIAIPDGSFPVDDRLETSNAGLVPFFREAKLSGKPVLLSETDGSLQKDLFASVKWCGYGEASRDVVVVPLLISGNLLGFYVQGTNPRRAYDEATEKSIVDMTRQMESKWNQSLSVEQAKLRELALESRALDSERRLRHMALSAPVGMVQIGPDEIIQWANDQFYQITGHDRSKPDMAAFRECLAPEGRPVALEGFRSMLNGAPQEVREYELVRKWKPLAGDLQLTEDVSAWMLTSSFPLTEDGKVKLVMGYVVEISHQKWSEGVQKRIAETAIQAKHRQEEFIDFVSHEVRNPLSAITQLADGIAQSLERGAAGDTEIDLDAIVEENVDAAATILALTTIQRRVIDDVLILSRLDSQLLSITPVVGRPWKVVRDAVAMFKGEARIHNMQFEALKDDSYNMFNVEWVYMDTSRLSQILINLLSNAVKFTTPRSVRKVTVTYGAQAGQQPQINTPFGEIEWMELDTDQPDVLLRPLRKGEETLYIYFCIRDTGVGISQGEKSRLFKRFSQASAKTHIAYGGSGLGLYICKELAHRQGGRVGLASRRGEGSAFGFYIETRHAVSPEPDLTAGLSPSSAANLPMRAPSILDVTETIPVAEGNNHASERSAIQSRTGEKQQTMYSILLVEDNLVNQKVLAKQLRAAECTVTIANHGQEALDKLKLTDCWRALDSKSSSDASYRDGLPHIDVVLMDIEMPVMGGIECCTRIRALEQEGQIARHLPIIATTANARQEQQETALNAGMDSVLSKPFVVRELLGSIKAVLETVHAAA